MAQRTSILGAKQQAHGRIGEDRTSGLLGSYFWLLKRNVDIDGADFLLETVASSIEEERLRRSRITATGVVQAKFFERGNSVRVRRDYAEEASKPRPEFFLLAHTNGKLGTHHHYFLTSEHITELPLSEDGKYRRFPRIDERMITRRRVIFPPMRSQVLFGIVSRMWRNRTINSSCVGHFFTIECLTR